MRLAPLVAAAVLLAACSPSAPTSPDPSAVRLAAAVELHLAASSPWRWAPAPDPDAPGASPLAAPSLVFDGPLALVTVDLPGTGAIGLEGYCEDVRAALRQLDPAAASALQQVQVTRFSGGETAYC